MVKQWKVFSWCQGIFLPAQVTTEVLNECVQLFRKKAATGVVAWVLDASATQSAVPEQDLKQSFQLLAQEGLRHVAFVHPHPFIQGAAAGYAGSLFQSFRAFASREEAVQWLKEGCPSEPK